jgi:Zn-finger nucleic acid-binding protein
MICPVCKNAELREQELETNLKTSCCDQCGGHWVPSSQYWDWRGGQGGAETEPEENVPSSETAIEEDGSSEIVVEDHKEAKICPECSHILTRRPVGRGLDFSLDRCGTCGGLWFDKNEWQVLKRHGLHEEVHFIFSAAWQAQVAKADKTRAYEERLQRLLGTEEFARAVEVRQWLQAHPHRNSLLAFLSQPDDGE